MTTGPKALTIKKKSFLYKFAYGLMNKNARPDETTRCKLFWRCVFMLFIGWPIGGLLRLVAYPLGGLIMGCVYGFGFLLAKKPCFDSTTTDMFVPIEKWPKFMGFRIWPIMVIFFSGLLYACWLVLWSLPRYASQLWSWLYSLTASDYFRTGALALIILLVIAVAISKFKRSQFYWLLKGYWSDFHKKWCPVIVFLDDDEKSTSEEDE